MVLVNSSQRTIEDAVASLERISSSFSQEPLLYQTLVAWLTKSNPSQEVMAKLHTSPAPLNYQWVALAALAEAAGWESNAETLEEGINWLSSVSLDRVGIPAPHTLDAVAQIALALAVKKRPRLDAWFNRVLEHASNERAPIWALCGPLVILRRVEALQGDAALRLALEAVGAGNARQGDDLDVLHAILQEELPSEPLRATVLSCALKWIRPRVLSAVDADQRFAGRALQASPWRLPSPPNKANRMSLNESRVDAIIVTAITLEFQALLQVEAGSQVGSSWTKELGPYGLPMAFRTFEGQGRRPLHFLATQTGDMGSVATVTALLPLVERYNPGCIAMCGVCAGRPGKTQLGDVVAAERLFFHDTGKQGPDGIAQDLKTYNLRDDWKVAIEHFDFQTLYQREAWWNERPIPHLWQEHWVLTCLLANCNPTALQDRVKFCPQWEHVLKSLWDQGLLKKGKLELTMRGRAHAEKRQVLHPEGIPDLSPSGKALPFKVHVAPMGSGNKVIEDEKIWGFISGHMRKALGLEMEAAALGALADTLRERRLDALVMKGVMDFANHGRDDHFKEFAARASAECLIAFLREQLSRADGSAEVRGGRGEGR